jgi:hypothetical protein
LNGAVIGNLKGYFVGAANPDVALGFSPGDTTADADTYHVLVGTLLLNRNSKPSIIVQSLLDTTVKTHNPDWRTWNNSIEDN